MAGNTSCCTGQDDQSQKGGGGFKERRSQLEAGRNMRVIRSGTAGRGRRDTERNHHEIS